jgi:hypothetical protein
MNRNQSLIQRPEIRQPPVIIKKNVKFLVLSGELKSGVQTGENEPYISRQIILPICCFLCLTREGCFNPVNQYQFISWDGKMRLGSRVRAQDW